ncbi:aminopeptidase [Peptostreptococcus sp. MV1]|uniref:M18 family aminopeptidase n=1 Tax=Peptostreptococcus sp. MV1 TaxID=1219626 RepID=UPI00050E1F45|nr:M18 family aminopeptidase [Peptostreptococcus sp. MV1]KGF10504.1 aminopeptidase [Peptostreptococcus sp. MV1]
MLNENSFELGQDLVDYINDSPTMYNAVENIRLWLDEYNFERLDLADDWNLVKGGKYYLVVNSSSIFAFVVAGERIEKEGFRIIGSHTDSPGFKLKPNPEIREGQYLKLNVEPYGGMILNTWLDRPLSLAGRVFTRNIDNPFKPIEHIVKVDRPICIIPNLAIHMNREINDGYTYNKQDDMAPLVLESYEGDEKEYIKSLLLREINMTNREKISIDDILDYDIYLYEYEKGSLIGDEKEYISCGRLDNLASLHASISALLYGDSAGRNICNEDIDIRSFRNVMAINESSMEESAQDKASFEGVRLVAAFNNEEVGSQTRQGADSQLLTNILERIALGLGKNKAQLLRSYESSFMISADLAHAVHPNKSAVADPTNRPSFAGGPTIKSHAGQAYASDAYSVAVYKDICDRNGIKYQTFANRSDKRSGSTIGTITASYLPIAIVDVGMPILAMHSIRELGHIDDYKAYYESLYRFFEI